jgi:WASH complex subunit 7
MLLWLDLNVLSGCLYIVCGLQIPAVNLVGNILWFPEQFLLAHLTHMAKLIDKKTQEVAKIRRQTYLQQKAQSVPKEARTFCLQVQ